MTTLKIIGCGDAFNSGGRRNTSFLLSHDKHEILIDCGANTLLGLKQLKIDFSQLECVIITHFHGDHYGGLPFIILEAAKIQKRKKPLSIISPPGLKERLYQLFALLYPGSQDALESFPIHYISYQSQKMLKFEFGNLMAFSVQHTAETLPHGIRLELKGKVFAYSGDTAWDENLIHLADGADLFVCECNFFETASSSHFNYVNLREKQNLLKSKKIVLTHLGEEMIDRQNEIKIERLREGQEIIF